MLDGKRECYIYDIEKISNISEVHDDAQTKLLISSDNGKIYILDVEQKKYECVNDSALNIVSDMKYIPSNKLVVMLGQDNEISIWDSLRKKRVASLNLENEKIYKCAYSEIRKKLILASIDGKVFDLDLEKLKLQKIYTTGRYLQSIEFDKTGRYIVTVSKKVDGATQIKIYDIVTENVKTINFEYFDIVYACFSPDEKSLLIIDRGGKYKKYEQINMENENGVEGKCIMTDALRMGGYFDRITSAIYSSEKQRIYLGTRDGNIQVFEAQSNDCIEALKYTTEGYISSVVVSSDGKFFGGIIKPDFFTMKYFLTKKFKSIIKLYNSETFKCEYIIPNIRKQIPNSIMFADKNQQVWIGDCAGMIEIWEKREKRGWRLKYSDDTPKIVKFYNNISNWFYRRGIEDQSCYDYYLLKTVPFIRGFKLDNAKFVNLHPKSTLNESDLSVLGSYSAIVK